MILTFLFGAASLHSVAFIMSPYLFLRFNIPLVALLFVNSHCHGWSSLMYVIFLGWRELEDINGIWA